jgi:phosphoribosyl 1,2-cyclic phosphodiesterase
VEVRSSSRECLIIDAGTGLRELGRKLARQQIAGGSPHYHIVLSHVHWDHIQGLPFFEPAYIKGTTISMYALRAAAEELQQVIGGITRHEYFPMPLESVPADFEFHEVRPGRSIEVMDFEIRPLALNHPFGAVGYRIVADNTCVAYVSDTAPFCDVLHKQHFLPGMPELTDSDRERLGELRAALIEGLRGVDTVIYDTHFLPEEYQRFPHWGHSTPDHALDICTGIGVRRLVLYHHAPAHGDDLMDEIARTYASRGKERGIEVVTAHELMTLRLGVEDSA